MIRELHLLRNCFGGGPTYGNWSAEKSLIGFALSGTWIAVSPLETIPEKYLDRIKENKAFRIYYDIPDDWKLIELSSEDTGHFDLVEKAKCDIYSIPGHRTIKEITVSGGYLWGVASGDLNYPMCYDNLVLKDFPWIENSDWRLICLGNSFNIEKTKKIFKDSLDSDIIFEDLF